MNTTVAVLTLLAGVAALKNKQSLATAAARVIGSYREYAIAIDGEAGDSLT